MIHSHSSGCFPVGLIFYTLFTFAAIASAGTYSGGAGTSTNPYKISKVADWQELIATSADYDKHFVLLNDIDFQGVELTPVAPDTNLSEFEFQGVPFRGSFDGSNHVFSHVKINLPSNDYIGLFGHVGLNGHISNLGVTEVDITGRYWTGGLVGSCSGNLRNCHTSGKVTTSDRNGQGIGGLAGVIYGTLIQCYSTATVSSNGTSSVGGFVGANYHGTLTDCYATGRVTGSYRVGGLVGMNGGSTIRDCYATGPVEGQYMVGGLMGHNWEGGKIFTCYSSGIVNGISGVGGLLGYNEEGVIGNCFWDIEASGQASSRGGIGKTTAEMMDRKTYVGWGPAWTLRDGQDYPHLAWENAGGEPLTRFSGGSGTEEDPYRISTVENWQELTVVWTDWDKHYILTNDLDMEGVTVLAVGPNYGVDYPKSGFTGVLDGSGHVIRNLSSILPTDSNSLPGSGKVWETNIMGLFGDVGRSGVIRRLGLENLQIRNDSNDRYYNTTTGGLVAHNEGEISECYVTGRVEAKGDMYGLGYVGGLVGEDIEGEISRCYADVTIPNGGNQTGGLVGIQVGGTIWDCYSISTILIHGKDIGGLIGNGSGSVYNCLWDTERSGQTTSDGGTGKTTAEMKTLSTFTGAGWDFVGESVNGTEDVWRMCEDGVSYPRLSWEFSQGGDMNCPDGVELEDLLYLAGRWMMGTPETVGAADVNGDGRVGIEDFAVMAENWMK